MHLRPYQHSVIAALRAQLKRRKLLVAPTGAGKTVIAAEIIRGTLGRVLFLAHRRELIHQARDKLDGFGIHAGIILAGELADPQARVQVASVQTLWTRAVIGRGREAMDLPPADVVIVDEAHRARARTYQRLLDSYPEAEIIGLTATPCRGDGRGLGNVFDAIVECPQVPELIDRGHLVQTLVYAPSRPDLTGVPVARGDYVEKHLAAAMDKSELVGDIVTHWHRLAQGRKTVVFASGVAHSIHLRDEFIRSGVTAAHIDGKTPKEERDAILARLSAGAITVVTNCMVLTEGWDQPDVTCIVLARPTKHMGLYRQMIGRGLRTFEGKHDCLVLDHAGAVFAHGFVEEPVIWTLDEDSRAEAPVHQSRKTGGLATRLTTCKQCSAVRTGGKPCPVCGYMPRRPGEAIEARDGELAEVGRDGRVHPHQYSPEAKREFHAMLAHIGRERGYKPGWASHKYKERFGHWPQDRNVTPQPPNAEVAAWDRHCRIRYAKRMQKETAHASA